MTKFLAFFLTKLVRHGHLEVETCDGVVRVFGDGAGPRLAVRLADRAAEREMTLNPELAIGELFMDGRLIVTHGDLYDLLTLGASNLGSYAGLAWAGLLNEARILLRRFHQRNDRARARLNVARHYDLDRRIYRLFLDADRQYSCAYFERQGQALEEAQLAKKRHLAAKLLIDERHRVLDIGCGLGGMALYLAEVAGAQRHRRHPVARAIRGRRAARARERGLGDRVDFRLQDYRDVEGPFDRIVSVGMFEHVGVADFDEYFDKVRRLLEGRRRHAAARDRAQRPAGRHQSVDREIHLPRRLHPGAVGSARRRSSDAGSSSPTSKSCGCTTPKR